MRGTLCFAGVFITQYKKQGTCEIIWGWEARGTGGNDKGLTLKQKIWFFTSTSWTHF